MASVEVIDTAVRVEARTTAGRAACPGCGCWSGRIHSSYLRFPRDLPTAGKFVVVSVRVRRFVCEEESCERMTFAEQVPALTRRFGRRTERLRSTLVWVGLALAGRSGARMTDAFKVPVSRNTLLRLIASLPDPATGVPRVAGMDEYAQRKGRVYGTVLVDVETRRRSTSFPIGRRTRSQSGSPSGPASRSSAVTGRPSSPKVPPAAPRRPSSRRPMASSGTTWAKPPRSASTGTVAACVPRRPSLRSRRKRGSQLRRPGRQGTGSPNAPAPSTPPSTLSSPPGTASGPSPGSSG